MLISSFLLFDLKTNNDTPSIFFNISMHAPFETLNRALFSLFICGCLNDASTGLIFSLPNVQRWKFLIEVPYSKVCGMSIEENFRQILPILAIIPSSTVEEVTGESYQLFMGEEEEVVARFLRAFSNGTINRVSITHRNGTDEEVVFAKITNPEQCRAEIYNCIEMFAPDLPRNKIYELSFTKFLYRRARFFEGHFFRWNQKFPQLGSVAMTQMIEEARSLTRINFRDNSYPRVFLVYDPEFSLHLLHGDWNHVPQQLKNLFDNQDPLQSNYYRNKDYFAECLAWLIDIRYEACMKVIEETKFILTENFAYKLFHVHERKLTKLALIIEGDTGVGKTFLLKFYSLLLNTKNAGTPLQEKVNPRILENSSEFIADVIEKFVKKHVNLLNLFLQKIKPKMLGIDNEDEEDNLRQQPLPLPIVPAVAVAATAEAELVDVDLLKEIELSLKNHRFDRNILYQMWRTIFTLWNRNTMDSTPELIDALYVYVNSELTNYPRNEGSVRLRELLQVVDSPSIKTCLEIFKEYLFQTQEKPLFYRLLLHPGITEEQLEDFMAPISQLARELPQVEIVVFFDEVNTSSCLGLFKEMFMDGTLYGTNIPKNIFFTAAINPLMKISDRTTQVHRNDFIVHDLPQAMKDLIVSYGALESRTLGDYIVRKIAMFLEDSKKNKANPMPTDTYFQNTLAKAILLAQEFCEKRLGKFNHPMDQIGPTT